MNLFKFIVMLIMPVTMIALSQLYKKKAKGPISDLSGFRTKLSKSSEENWEFAHMYLSKLSLITGIILLIITVFIASNINLTYLEFTIFVFLQVGVMIVTTIITHFKLKSRNKKEA